MPKRIPKKDKAKPKKGPAKGKKSKYQFTTHDPGKAIARYKETHKDKYSENVDQVISQYTRKGKVQIRLIPAPWSLVLIYAVVNGFAVFIGRLLWFETFGRPSSDLFTPSHQIEEPYERKGIEG